MVLIVLAVSCGDARSVTILSPGVGPQHSSGVPFRCTSPTTCTGLPTAQTPELELVKVCKYYPASVVNPPAVQVRLDVATSNATPSPTSLVFTIDANSCKKIWSNGFSGGSADNVTLQEVVPPGYTTTSQVTTIMSTDGSFTTTTTTTLPATSASTVTGVVGGTNIPGLTVVFTNTPIPLGAIGDFVWHDFNGNGVQDAGEPGIAGVTVSLNTGATTVTDAGGYYSFTNLTPGTYTVSVSTPSGFVPAPSNAGGDPNKDSNGSGAATSINGNTDTSIDFGFYQLGSIGDFVWNDLNGNGIQESGEPGIAGVTVSLSNGATTTTSAGGAYAFNNLTPGTYTVTVATPAGFAASPTGAGTTATDNNGSGTSVTISGNTDNTIDFGFRQNACPAGLISSLTGASVTNYLFIFMDGSLDANWQGATKGFAGNVVVSSVADKRTSGGVPYAGTISTDGVSLGAWDAIVTQNAGQAFRSLSQGALVTQMRNNLTGAFASINALPVTTNWNSRSFASVSAASLDALNTQNGIPETFVINVTSGFQVSLQVDITGDAGDLFILRWDTDANFANGYQGQVKFQSGGAIVPHGGLTAANFIHVAGDINASGGGSNPPAPYPQGPRFGNGTGALIAGAQNFNGGGFFTGYWLTTGAPTTQLSNGLWVGQTASLSNGIFVGGWYSLTTKFSMTSGTSGVHVECP